MLRCWDLHPLLLLHVQWGQSHEPGPRPLWNLHLFLCLVSALSVCLSALSQCSSHTDLWLVSSVSPAPTPCMKHRPSSLHLLEMSFARDVQFSLQSPFIETMAAFNLCTGFWCPEGLLLLPSPSAPTDSDRGAPSLHGAAAQAQLPWSWSSAHTDF